MIWTTLESGYGIIHRSVMDSRMSRGAKLVYAFLCSYANSETGEAFPSQERIAAKLGCTEKPVREWLDELVEAGRIDKRLEGMPAHNVYTLLYPTRQSGTVLPDKHGSVVPLKHGTVLPANKNNEQEEEPPAPIGGAASPSAGDEARTSRVMSAEEFEAIRSQVPWNRDRLTGKDAAAGGDA